MGEDILSDENTDILQYQALQAVAILRDQGVYDKAEALRQAHRIQRQTQEMTGTIITDEEIHKILSQKPPEQESDQGAD